MRNREIKIFILGCIGLCLPFFLIAAAASREMLIVCVSLAAVLISAFCLFTAWRYRRLRQLNDQMRRVREGLYQMNPQDYEEGELSILHSEIYKVTVQLRESAEQLQAQQQFLSDSLQRYFSSAENAADLDDDDGRSDAAAGHGSGSATGISALDRRPADADALADSVAA